MSEVVALKNWETLLMASWWMLAWIDWGICWVVIPVFPLLLGWCFRCYRCSRGWDFEAVWLAGDRCWGGYPVRAVVPVGMSMRCRLASTGRCQVA